jgi:hypothetical protein
MNRLTTLTVVTGMKGLSAAISLWLNLTLAGHERE